MQVETVVNRFTDRFGDEWIQREVREAEKRILEEEWQIYIPSVSYRGTLVKDEEGCRIRASGSKSWTRTLEMGAWLRHYPDLVIEFYGKIEG